MLPVKPGTYDIRGSIKSHVSQFIGHLVLASNTYTTAHPHRPPYPYNRIDISHQFNVPGDWQQTDSVSADGSREWLLLAREQRPRSAGGTGALWTNVESHQRGDVESLALRDGLHLWSSSRSTFPNGGDQQRWPNYDTVYHNQHNYHHSIPDNHGTGTGYFQRIRYSKSSAAARQHFQFPAHNRVLCTYTPNIVLPLDRFRVDTCKYHWILSKSWCSWYQHLHHEGH